MNGLEAINACNGWSMAVVGASIVFSGLVVLSLAISQLKKVIAYIEGKGSVSEQEPGDKAAGPEKSAKPVLPDHDLGDLDQVVHFYQPLFQKLGETFQLSELYRLTMEGNFPHPHLTIKLFRQANILTPVGDGTFTVNE